ncbi:S-Ena type endospore appendage [Lysinibacillus louembei]|uniref:S-Ena type endospore appendage n=1 Tax=Lysinibacillus louembei TaxID=1470088 RepID=A0ABZ0RQ57_9BACI|nr:S-Ena type endospore appendage [Lysinibacillus louembei]WPK10362.1 S-Ena type endospore appendage [Lysinibacillus louembei]
MAKLGSCCGNKTSVHDSVCQDLTLADETPVTVWENSTPFAINGTILVENASSSTGDVTLSVTSNPATPAIAAIAPGNSVSITANNITEIQLAGTATGVANVKISYSLNYNF